MRNILLYRVLAWVGVVTALAFGIVLAFYYGTQNPVLLAVAGLCASATIIICIVLYFSIKRFSNSEELSNMLKEASEASEELDENAEEMDEKASVEGDTVGESADNENASVEGDTVGESAVEAESQKE